MANIWDLLGFTDCNKRKFKLLCCRIQVLPPPLAGKVNEAEIRR